MVAARFYAVLEHPFSGWEVNSGSGNALARVVEAHPALAGLMDFCGVDPVQIALAVGMVYPYEEDGADDLADLDLGPQDWFEPAAGLAAVRQAAAAIRADTASVAAAIYDPGLRPPAIIADLEAIESVLVLAGQHETRFHFILGSAPTLGPIVQP